MLRIASPTTSPKTAEQSDIELIALGGHFDAANADLDAFDVQMENIADRASESIEAPEALQARAGDRVLLDFYNLSLPAGGYYSIDAVSAFRRGRHLLSDQDRARKREIVAAWDYWITARAALENAMGNAELRPRRGQTLARARDIGKQIMLIPARSVTGAIVKARVARWCNGENIEYSTGELTDYNIVDSLIDDLLAMAADRPPSPLAGAAAANRNESNFRDTAVA